MADKALPDYESPPVVEIVAAVQFVPLPQFGMSEAVAVARAFDGYTVLDVPAALPPIVEGPPGTLPRQSFSLNMGTQPVRLLLQSANGRWVVQLQQDRIAVHERRLKKRPSFKNVRPELRRVSQRASEALGRPLLGDEHPPELAELIYDNRLPQGQGWKQPGDLHRILRLVAAPPKSLSVPIEQMSVAFTSVRTSGTDFVGRLHVHAQPIVDPAADLAQIHLQLISHRYLRNRSLTTVLGDCHRDIVEGFTAVTTPQMHKIWGRYQ